MSEEAAVRCPECQFTYRGHQNQFGKICSHCGGYIEPDSVLPIVDWNARRKRILQQTVREMTKNKLQEQIRKQQCQSQQTTPD